MPVSTPCHEMMREEVLSRVEEFAQATGRRIKVTEELMIPTGRKVDLSVKFLEAERHLGIEIETGSKTNNRVCEDINGRFEDFLIDGLNPVIVTLPYQFKCGDPNLDKVASDFCAGSVEMHINNDNVTLQSRAGMTGDILSEWKEFMEN